MAAIFVEPIQGEGGYIVPPAGWLADLRRLCDEHGILLVIDEVQSGVGRTGTMWACEHDGVEPDIMCIGKGLASGLPLAGIVARARGHGLGARRSRLDVRRQPRRVRRGARHARRSSRTGWPPTRPPSAPTCSTASDALQATQPLIDQVRGRGLMIGIDLPDHDTADAVERACFERGLLVLTCGVRSIRMAPPLVVTTEQADIALGDPRRRPRLARRCGMSAAAPRTRSPTGPRRSSPPAGRRRPRGDLAARTPDHRRLARRGRRARRRRPAPSTSRPTRSRRGARRRRRCAATSCGASASCSASTRTTSARWCRSRPARSAPRASARSRR